MLTKMIMIMTKKYNNNNNDEDNDNNTNHKQAEYDRLGKCSPEQDCCCL